MHPFVKVIVSILDQQMLIQFSCYAEVNEKAGKAGVPPAS